MCCRSLRLILAGTPSNRVYLIFAALDFQITFIPKKGRIAAAFSLSTGR